MTFFTKTLFGRTVLVLLLTVLFTQLATTFVVQQFYVRPLLEHAIDDRANHIQTIYTTLNLLSSSQRALFIRDFEDSEGARILSLAPEGKLSRPNQGGRLAYLEARLHHLISPSVRVLTTDGSEAPAVWILLKTTNGDYWYVTQRQRFDAGFPVKWGLLLALLILVTVMGVYWGVRRINKPLRVLTDAAQSIALGHTPALISETQGPQEIRALSNAFSSMQRALNAFETNRAIMLAGVSHDLRTPLSRMRLALEMMVCTDQKTLELMVQDLEEIDRIIDQFLDFARNEPENWLTTGNLNEVLRVCHERFLNRHYPVSLVLEETPDIALNERAMERVISNLVENSLRYGAAPIEILLTRQPRGLRLCILDRGPGIPVQEVGRLMQPFTRRESARSGHPGSGLGLAIVDRIIRMHHGRFELLPREGGGLVARIELPLLPQDSPPAGQS